MGGGSGRCTFAGRASVEVHMDQPCHALLRHDLLARATIFQSERKAHDGAVPQELTKAGPLLQLRSQISAFAAVACSLG